APTASDSSTCCASAGTSRPSRGRPRRHGRRPIASSAVWSPRPRWWRSEPLPVERGQPWGEHGALPADGVVVRSDAEARAVLEAARGDGRPYPPLGLLGGDLCRTIGGPGDEHHLRSAEAMRFPVDLGEVLLDGRLHLFVAH